jgi:hypothetical protein
VEKRKSEKGRKERRTPTRGKPKGQKKEGIGKGKERKG